MLLLISSLSIETEFPNNSLIPCNSYIYIIYTTYILVYYSILRPLLLTVLALLPASLVFFFKHPSTIFGRLGACIVTHFSAYVIFVLWYIYIFLLFLLIVPLLFPRVDRQDDFLVQLFSRTSSSRSPLNDFRRIRRSRTTCFILHRESSSTYRAHLDVAKHTVVSKSL